MLFSHHGAVGKKTTTSPRKAIERWMTMDLPLWRRLRWNYDGGKNAGAGGILLRLLIPAFAFGQGVVFRDLHGTPVIGK